MSALLVVFEGVDGAGKATQAFLLADALRALGRPVLVLSLPNYASASGALLRAHLRGEWLAVAGDSDFLRRSLLRPRTPELDERNFRIRQSLMLVNMAEVDGTIRAALASGTDIILDRWWASAVAYGVAEGLDPDPILAAASVLVRPDAWIVLDIPPSVGRSRRPGPARDLNEGDQAKLERARTAYRALFSARGMLGSAHPGGGAAPAAVVDGSGPPDRVHASVLEALRTLLGKRFPC